jgi:hypothetical protein
MRLLQISDKGAVREPDYPNWVRLKRQYPASVANNLRRQGRKKSAVRANIEENILLAQERPKKGLLAKFERSLAQMQQDNIVGGIPEPANVGNEQFGTRLRPKREFVGYRHLVFPLTPLERK